MPAGELGAGDQRQPLGQRGDRLGVAADGVVVGERDDVQPGRGGVAHQLGGGVRAVRRGGVGVQVDAHDADSSASTGRNKGTLKDNRRPEHRPRQGAITAVRRAARRQRHRRGPYVRLSSRGESAPHGTRSTSAPASRRSVSTSSSYISSPDCSGQTTAHSHSPRASPAKTARSSGAPVDVPQRGGPSGGEHLGVRRLVDAHVRAGVGAVDPRVARAEPDAQLLGDQQQLAGAAERAGARAGHGGGAAAAAVVARAGHPGEQPADRQRPGHPHRHLGAVHDHAERLDAGRDDRLQRMHGAVHVALPGVGEETGRPDPATALRATGFAPHRAPRSSPPVARVKDDHPSGVPRSRTPPRI